MRMLTLTAACCILAASSFDAAAQTSLYTQSQLGYLKNQNTASGYSTDRVRRQVVNSSIPNYAFSKVNRGLLNSAIGGGQARAQKPFSSLNRGPAVTPYLALDSPFTSTASSYYSLVRPQMEQQRINDQLQQRNLQLQKQLNSVAAQGPYDPQGSENRAPTGHAAVYMNYGGYYPEPQAPAGQQRR